MVGSFPTGMNAGFICCLFTGFISCFQPFSDWVYLESEFPVAAAEKGRPNVNANLQESYVFALSYAREFLKLDYVTCGVWYPICNIMSDYCANLNWRRWT